MTEEPLYDLADDPTQYGLTPDQKFYRFPPPPGVTVPKGWRGWTRATNLVGAFSDQRALALWQERQIILGLLENEGTIFDELAVLEPELLTDELLNKYADKAREAVGADTAARRGTARHSALETYVNTGRIQANRRIRLQLESLQEALEANELDVVPGWSERKIWHPADGGTMGTLDLRVLDRRTGRVGILDLKTQARFWTYQEICGQQALYDSAPWVWEGPPDSSGQWVPNPYFEGRWDSPLTWTDALPTGLLGHPDGDFWGRPVALLAHMPQAPGEGQLPVEIHEVDLDYGQEVIEQAARIRDLRSRGKSVAGGRRVGALRPPSALARRE